MDKIDSVGFYNAFFEECKDGPEDFVLTMDVVGIPDRDTVSIYYSREEVAEALKSIATLQFTLGVEGTQPPK